LGGTTTRERVSDGSKAKEEGKNEEELTLEFSKVL